jgi:ribosome-associated toxin RatA of RatAB toxin-antitoxin module
LITANTIISDSTYCQTNKWKLEKNKSGIQVYTRKTEGSSIKEFKARTIIKTKMSAMVKLIEDAEKYPDWQANITTAKTLKIVNSTTKYIHYSTDVPWPIDDRDIVVKCTKSVSDKGKTTFTLVSTPTYMKKVKGYIRIEKAKGTWKFIPRENGYIEIVYQSYGDPGGNLPDWVINMFIVDGPFKTLMNIKNTYSSK